MFSNAYHLITICGRRNVHITRVVREVVGRCPTCSFFHCSDFASLFRLIYDVVVDGYVISVFFAEIISLYTVCHKKGCKQTDRFKKNLIPFFDLLNFWKYKKLGGPIFNYLKIASCKKDKLEVQYE